MDILFRVPKLNHTGSQNAQLIAFAFNKLLTVLNNVCPECREFAIAKSKLEESCFYSKKAMASNRMNQEVIQSSGVESEAPAPEAPTTKTETTESITIEQMAIDGQKIKGMDIAIDEFKSMIRDGDKYWFSPAERDAGKTYWRIKPIV